MTPQLISGCRERRAAEPKDKREAIRLRNRRAIIAAAGELTAELGTEGVSVNGLAERAGVSRRTIFNHFPSAQDAAFEYLSELVTELIDTVLDDLPEPTEPETASLGEVYRQLIGALRARVLIGDLQPVFSVDVQETQAASLWGYRVTRMAVERLERGAAGASAAVHPVPDAPRGHHPHQLARRVPGRVAGPHRRGPGRAGA